MQLNSYEFILMLLPITLLCYFTVGRIHITARKLVICVSGAVVFAYAGLKGFVILLVSMAMNYLLSEMMLEAKWLRKPVLILTIAMNVLVLFVFKYTNFLIVNFNHFTGRDIGLLNLSLPLGISFFTFQQIAYVVNVYNGKIEKPIMLDYIAYILFFPKLIMGPIVDPVDLIAQMNDPSLKKWNWANFVSGLRLFSFGLFKKMVLADTFAKAVGWGSDNLGTATSLDLILIMLSYTFQIYFDFSGYSDMATGAASMMNLKLPMNFDSPYKAVSVRDFWNRWHMSLTGFLTKYVYIPLGGSRKGKERTYINVVIVFLISGIWHGANWTFILWGAAYGVLSVADRILEPLWTKLWKPFRWLITFLIINVMWSLFNAGSVEEWRMVLLQMVRGGGFTVSTELAACFHGAENLFLEQLLHIADVPFVSNGIVSACFLLTAGLLLCLIPKNGYRLKDNNGFFYMLVSAVAFAWSFLCLGTETVFIYNYF